MINFVTTPINAGTQYQITDTTTGYSAPTYIQKIVRLRAPDQTILFEDTNVPLSTNVIVVDVDSSLWLAKLATIQITVELAYLPAIGLADSLVRGYALPTTLNLSL